LEQASGSRGQPVQARQKGPAPLLSGPGVGQAREIHLPFASERREDPFVVEKTEGLLDPPGIPPGLLVDPLGETSELGKGGEDGGDQSLSFLRLQPLQDNPMMGELFLV